MIAFDAVFSEPDRLNPDIAADTFRNLDEATRDKLRALPSNDQILADAIRASRVVLGESGGPTIRPLDKNLPVTGLAMLGEEPQPFMFQFPGLLRNVEVLEQAAAGRGLFTIRPERDGIVRRVPMIMVAQGITMPSLTFEMLRVASGSGTILIKADKAGIQSVGVKGFQLPTDANGQLWVHYARLDPSIYVSAVDVLDGRVPQDKIAGKLILIGTSATGLNDIKTTPVSPRDAGRRDPRPGAGKRADRRGGARSRTTASRIEFFGALVLGILVIAFAPNFGPITLVAVGAVFATVLAGTSWFFYTQHQLLVDFTYPLMSTTAIYLTLIFSSFVREQKQRRQIRSAFGQYISPALVEQLAQSPEKLVLGGEEREMTIMFSDMRGFTSISETYKSDPQGLTSLMNRFLTPLTNAILARKGTIDKYMGDAIMAFWNAPLDDKQHQINACEAALDMLERVDALNRSASRKRRMADTSTFRSMSASASIPAPAWSAIWAPTCASTIRCWATASIWPRAWKAIARNTAFRSSSARKPRWR